VLDPGVDRDSVMRGMLGRGVQTSVHYPPVHEMSVHLDLDCGPLPITEEVARRQLTLPLHPKMSLQDVDYVVDSLIQCL
ncbi:MAG: DegT/DnrJ/EryC1/StrS family aminotransferase, partial [Gemmatimonadetes bacterium]|nr:DegT/DnrJ/EryC1/StrS family aminotransferase [Gemmatimonadota bacterium]